MVTRIVDHRWSQHLTFHLKRAVRPLATQTAPSQQNLDPVTIFPDEPSPPPKPRIEQRKHQQPNQNQSNFFEDYVCHELLIDRKQLQTINFLFNDSIRKNYATNESLMHLCKFLKMFFTADDLTDNPRPFSTPYFQLYNRTMLLKEIGFRSFQVSMVVDHTGDIMKLDLSQLKRYLNYPPDQNGFEAMCKTLNIYGDSKTELIKYIQANHGDLEQIALNELRILCTAQYVSGQFNVPFTKAYHLCRRYAKWLNELSFATIKTNINYLRNNFNYSNHKMIQTGLFFMTNPENLTAIATKLKPAVGDHVYITLVATPQVLKLECQQIIDNYRLIKDRCDGKFFSRAIELLPVATGKLAKMFDQLEKNDDVKQANLKALGFDYLVLNQQKILERLAEVKREEVPFHHVPLSFYMLSETEFDRALSDLTADAELRVKFFLETRFNIDLATIKDKLLIAVPANSGLAQRFTLANANRVVEYLISMNVDKDLIVRSIPLILYDFRQVKNFFVQLNNNRRAKDQDFFQSLFEHLQTVSGGGNHRQTKPDPNE